MLDIVKQWICYYRHNLNTSYRLTLYRPVLNTSVKWYKLHTHKCAHTHPLTPGPFYMNGIMQNWFMLGFLGRGNYLGKMNALKRTNFGSVLIVTHPLRFPPTSGRRRRLQSNLVNKLPSFRGRIWDVFLCCLMPKTVTSVVIQSRNTLQVQTFVQSLLC